MVSFGWLEFRCWKCGFCDADGWLSEQAFYETMIASSLGIGNWELLLRIPVGTNVKYTSHARSPKPEFCLQVAG